MLSSDSGDELQARRLTRRSEALALEEFQLIDLNFNLMKTTESNGSHQSIKKNASIKLNSKTSLGISSNPDVKKTGSKRISQLFSLLEGRKSKSTEKVANSSSTGILKTCILGSNSGDFKANVAQYEAKAVKSLEETVLKVTSLNKLDGELDQKQSEVRFNEETEPESPASSKESEGCRGICRKETCMSSVVRLPPIKRTDSQQVAWDVRGLGVPPAAKEKQTFSIQKVHLRRKERHEYITQEIDLRMHDLNDVIEQEIRRQAESVVSNMHMIKDNVEHILATIKEKPDINLTKNLVLKMQEIIKQLNDSRLNNIDSFCEVARKLERHRSERFKLILKDAYKEMHDNMFLMPYEIQKFFEKKVQHLNEITMNNYHVYTELEKKLKLQMEEETRQWFQALKCNEMVRISMEETGKSFKGPISEVIPEETAGGSTKEKIKIRLDKAEQDFHSLKQIAKNLKYLKSHPILEVFENYLDEMRNAVFALFQSGLVDQKGLCLDEQAIRDLSHMNCMDIEDLQKLWQDAIQNMLKTLEDNLKSFTNSTRIFDAHFDRMEEMRTLYKQELFLLITKNDKQTMQMNTSMNLLVDILRQDVTEDNLNRTLQQIQTTIQNIDALIRSHCKDEISLVDKFLQFSMLNIDILLDELARFVKQFVPPPDADPRIMKKRASWMNVDELKTNDHLFSRDFLNCRFLMQGIDNWQFGVWHALVTSMDTLKQVISDLLATWSNNEKQKLNRRSDLKITMNNVRIHNIKSDFWKVRLAELKMHEKRFLQHEVAIRENFSQLGNLKRQMEETCTNFLNNEYKEKIEEIMIEYHSIKKERHVISIMNKLRGFKLSATLDMKDRHDCFKKWYFCIVTDIRDSHIKFMKSIRLFSEEGNFTADEAKMLIKKIAALEKLMSKELPNCKENIERIYENFFDVCQEKLEVPLQTLDKALEEFTFKDEVDRRFKKLQRQIGETVLDVDSEMRRLDEKIKNCRSTAYSDSNLGSYDFIFAFSRSFKDILADIDLLAQTFHYDDSLAPNEKLIKQRFEVSQVSLSPTLASKPKKNVESKATINDATGVAKKFERKRSVRAASSLMKTKSYAFVLYPFIPEDNSFHAEMHKKTYSAYCGLQDVAKAFYDVHGEVLDNNRVPSDYKYFIEEILLKFKYYQLQLEFAWLECANEFYGVVKNFRKFLENYYTDQLAKFYDLSHKELKGKCSEVMKILEDEMKSVEHNYTSIHNKLMPMFGHPDNARILAIVETYIDQAEEFNKKTLIDNLDPKKEVVKHQYIKIETFFLDMEKIMSCIKGSATLFTVRKMLGEKLTERIEIMKEILSLELEPEDEIQTDFVNDSRRVLQQYKMKAQIPTEYLLPYPNVLQSTSTPTSCLNLDTEEFIKNNHNEYEKTVEKIENIRKRCTDLHSKYKIMWAQDIDRILNLYKIKYDDRISN